MVDDQRAGVVHSLPGKGCGAWLLTCLACSAPFRQTTRGVFEDVRPLDLGDHEPGYCMHCYWCGEAVHVPLRGVGAVCILHGDEGCPGVRPEDTVQAGRVARMLRLIGLELTDDGWLALGEEILVCGHYGVSPAGAIMHLCSSPDLVRELRR